MGWQPIETAPKDGRRIWLVNSQMEQPIIGEWSNHYCRFSGKESRQWIVVHDPHERFMPLAYGALCCPDLWMPLPSPPKEA